MKMVTFEWVSLGGVDYYTAPKSEEDFSGEYVSLAEYQRLEALLKRWNEIAPNLSDYQIDGTPITSDKLIQLIQDTQEVLK